MGLVIRGALLVIGSAMFVRSTQAIEELHFNGAIDPEISFTFEYDKAYASTLKTQYDLDIKISDCSTDLDKILVICDWVHDLWPHNGDNIPGQSDPLSILHEAIQEKKQFRCVEYSIVLNGCLNALDIPCRILSLKTADSQTREYGAGHVVNEAYLADLDKWVMIDCQENLIPVLDGIPLHAVELQKLLAQKSNVGFISKNGAISTDDAIMYVSFIQDYLFYFQTKSTQSFIQDGNNHSVMLVPAGAAKPVVFQKIHPLTNIRYTHSLPSFYQKQNMKYMYKIFIDYSPNEADNEIIKEGIDSFNQKVMGSRDKQVSFF